MSRPSRNAILRWLFAVLLLLVDAVGILAFAYIGYAIWIFGWEALTFRIPLAFNEVYDNYWATWRLAALSNLAAVIACAMGSLTLIINSIYLIRRLIYITWPKREKAYRNFRQRNGLLVIFGAASIGISYYLDGMLYTGLPFYDLLTFAGGLLVFFISIAAAPIVFYELIDKNSARRKPIQQAEI